MTIARIIETAAVAGFILLAAEPGPAAPLFEEKFEDAALASRGWYDNTTVKLSAAEHLAGSVASAEYHFLQWATTPEISGGAVRKKFTPSESVYISFFIKHSPNWIGSGLPYQPHQFNLLTTADGGSCGDYCGLSTDHLTVYIEENSGKPVLAIQDALNIDQTRIGQDLSLITEQRAVAGCNGFSRADGSDPEDCYAAKGAYRNSKTWRTSTSYFQDVPGPYSKADWHHVEVFIRLNSIVNNKGIADGAFQYWYDGTILIDHSNVLFRTGLYPTMKFNQFIIAPYIGDGSPVDQAFWIDDLVVATAKPGSAVPAAPKNLRVH